MFLIQKLVLYARICWKPSKYLETLLLYLLEDYNQSSGELQSNDLWISWVIDSSFKIQESPGIKPD